MSPRFDIMIGADDAAILNELILRNAHTADAQEARDALTEMLFEATVVDARALPPGTVRLHSTVAYEELPSGIRRRVTLVNPREADAGRGRISVFSPIGRALLGQRKDRVIDAALPAGRRMSLRVLESTAPDADLALEGALASLEGDRHAEKNH
jgi:regulator of nucleoside diphosphate kinase